MDGVMHIVSVLTAPWCGWTMLVLLLCAVLAEFFQPGVITQAPAAMFARTDRTYKESPANFMGQLMITLFRIGTLALALCLCFCSINHVHFVAFWAICGIIVAVLMVKMLLNVLLDNTFFLSRRFGSAYEAYGNIVTTGTVVLYPVMMILMHVSNPLAVQGTIAALAILFLCAWMFRAVRTYVVSPASVFYLVLYIATLEVLPMALIFYLSAKTIRFI
jgi:hypothetical protein